MSRVRTQREVSKIEEAEGAGTKFGNTVGHVPAVRNDPTVPHMRIVNNAPQRRSAV